MSGATGWWRVQTGLPRHNTRFGPAYLNMYMTAILVGELRYVETQFGRLLCHRLNSAQSVFILGAKSWNISGFLCGSVAMGELLDQELSGSMQRITSWFEYHEGMSAIYF